MTNEQKDPLITLRLSRNVAGQICEGLHERMLVWRATAQYLEEGYTDISDFIEECHHSYEAKAIADWYEEIIQSIRDQVDAQTPA